MESTDDILPEEAAGLLDEEKVHVRSETQEKQKQLLDSAYDFLIEAKDLLEDGLKKQELTLLGNFNSAELKLQAAIKKTVDFIAFSVENPNMPLEITEYEPRAYLFVDQDLNNPGKRAKLITEVLQLMEVIKTFIKYIGEFRINVYSYGIKEKNA